MYLYDYENNVDNDQHIMIIAESSPRFKDYKVCNKDGTNVTLQREGDVPEGSIVWTCLHSNAFISQSAENISGNYIYKNIPIYFYSGFNGYNFLVNSVSREAENRKIIMDLGLYIADIILVNSEYSWIISDS